MTRYPNRLWIIVLLLGWIFDFLFWGESAGINFAIFVTVTLIAGFYLLLIHGQKPALKSLWLVVPLVFFAIMTFWRREPLTLFLAYTFTLFSLGVFAVTYLGGRWTQYGLWDYFNKFFQLLGSMLASPISFFMSIRKKQPESGEMRKSAPVLPIVRGLLIALPIVAFFAALLASADLVFNQKLIHFFELFDINRIGEYFCRLFIILFFAYILAGIFLHAASKSQDGKLLGEDRPIVKPFLGFTECSIVLGSVIVLFLLFVIVQFRYFFGGDLNISFQDFTYSQYARRGFNELVTVAFFSLVMILGLSAITKRENNFQRRFYSGSSIALVVLVMVILLSAFQRLAMVIDGYGFTRLRLYPQIFMVWVGILFVAVVILEVFRRERYFALAVVLASIGFAVSLSVFDVDNAIVRHNISRASQGRQFDVPYLATLSPDSVPALVDGFTDSSLPNTVHEGIGAALVCHLHSDAIADTSNDDWRSFNLSSWNARRALESIEVELKSYRAFVAEVWEPVRVRTPGNVSYICNDTYPDRMD